MITNPMNKIYIGSTINIEQRWNSYKKYKCKDQPKIYNSLLKYGAENHKFEIIWEGSLEEMYKNETLLGQKFNVLDANNLNLCLPKLGDSYSCVSEETRNKIGKAHKGKILSKETKEKISLSKQNISQKTRDKMSISAKNKTITDETKKRIIRRNKKKKRRKKFRKKTF